MTHSGDLRHKTWSNKIAKMSIIFKMLTTAHTLTCDHFSAQARCLMAISPRQSQSRIMASPLCITVAVEFLLMSFVRNRFKLAETHIGCRASLLLHRLVSMCMNGHRRAIGWILFYLFIHEVSLKQSQYFFFYEYEYVNGGAFAVFQSK